MTCQNAANESGTGINYARLCRSIILLWDNFTLRTASSPRRTSRLRPDGLSTLGIRDTRQNASQVQDAFRSLHYVAVTCLPPSACPTVTTISTPHFENRPYVAWGQAPKSMLKTLCYSDIIRSYRLNGRKREFNAEYSRSYLASLKKLGFLA